MVNRLDVQYTVAKERLDLQRQFDQMFSMPTEKKGDVTKIIAEGYLNYKKSHVKHLLFSPDTQNMSEFIQFTTLNDTILFQPQ